MEAVYLRGVEDAVVTTVPDPCIPGQGILVRVEACAVCGTDVKMYRHGYAAAKFPLIPGHEIAGKIERLEGNYPRTLCRNARGHCAEHSVRRVPVLQGRAPDGLRFP